jgi:hypothetical protein
MLIIDHSQFRTGYFIDFTIACCVRATPPTLGMPFSLLASLFILRIFNPPCSLDTS